MVFTPNQNWISESKKNVTNERPRASLPTLARWWERLRIPLVPDCESIKNVCVASEGHNGGPHRTVWEALLETEKYVE